MAGTGAGPRAFARRRGLPANINSRPEPPPKLNKVTNDLIQLLQPPGSAQDRAIGDGCAAGFGLEDGVSGTLTPLSEATSNP
jgi:hypothetical protein